MVSSINWMVSQGCKVIVDDLGFYGESFFADGPIAQAAESAISAGVVYVSAAGNESETVGEVGDFHYDHEFVDDGSTQNFNNFNPTGTKDDFMDFDVLGDATVDVILQWSDPFGASSNDYDLYLYGSIIARSWPKAMIRKPVRRIRLNRWSTPTAAARRRSWRSRLKSFPARLRASAIWCSAMPAAGICHAGRLDHRPARGDSGFRSA